MRYAIVASEALAPESIKNAVIVVEDGTIAAVGPRDAIELPAGIQEVSTGDAVVAPGFIDLHIHGAKGYDTMQPDFDGLQRMAAFLATKGVTSFVPTTVTAAHDKTQRALEHLGKHAGQSLARPDLQAATPIGIHLEGPFLSSARPGVHPTELLEDAAIDLFEQMWTASSGKVVLMTVAPELNGAIQLIRNAVGRNVRISLGHSNATQCEAEWGVDTGATHATHTFNAMRPLAHREPGIIGVVLTDERLTADMIVDGVHVDPTIVRLFLRSKGRDRAVLITDAMSATGMPDGKYQLGSFEVEVNGPRCESNGKLAGSVLTLDLAVRNVMKMAKWSLADSVRLATLNPARVLGLEKKKGSLRVGADADLVLLSKSGEVIRTAVAGNF